MKFLKISFFASLFLFTLNLSAQRPGGGPGLLPNLDSMRVKLSLSADQETKIKGVISTYRPKLKEARDSNTDQAARRQAMAPLLQSMQEEIRVVLNDEQKAKLDAMKANRPKRGKKAK